MQKNNKIVYITWGNYSSRAESVANVLNAELIFIGKTRAEKNLFISSLLYISYAYQNILILLKLKPNILIITNTTWAVALVNFVYAKIAKIKLVLDSHSCAFDYVFYKYPLFLSKLFAKYSSLSLVTNHSHHKLLTEIGARVLILSDIPFEGVFDSIKKINLSHKFNICYICSFSYDEPYMELIKATSKFEDIQFYITGNYPIVKLNPQDYPHIKFTGYITNEEYRSLLKSTDAIITLTRNEDTMQRAGSESISVGKPLIISGTKMLMNYFKHGAIFVNNTTEGIVEGINILRKNYEFYSSEILLFQKERKKKFVDKLNELNEYLELK